MAVFFGIYAAPDRDIVISDGTSPEDLRTLKSYALQQIKSGTQSGYPDGFRLLSVIADVQAMQAKPLMFKSARAA